MWEYQQTPTEKMGGFFERLIHNFAKEKRERQASEAPPPYKAPKFGLASIESEEAVGMHKPVPNIL
jgi:hypothetical protein